MTAFLDIVDHGSIMQEILLHPAWHGEIRGLEAEKKLREKKTPYLYLLRAGEKISKEETDYYVTFLLPDFSIKHQPFIIRETSGEWSYEQGGSGGPYIEGSIDDVLHEIMHCDREQCVPLPKIQ
ncbi:MAG: hypothetical protein JSR80_05835 [Verrucomicrobia bacterium]|nr:hypothetical protein [Verrucomicrobiota bacterium]